MLLLIFNIRFVYNTVNLKRQNSWPPDVSALDALNDYTWQRHLAEKSRFKCIVYKTNNKYYEILTIYELHLKIIDDLRL